MGRIAKPVGAEAGYLYDYYRSQDKTNREEKENYEKLQKKINKLSKKNKLIKLKK